MDASETAAPDSPKQSALSRHWPLLLVALLAAVPLFANLGGSPLWADEGDTAVLSRNILEYGVPSSWDGRTFIDSDSGKRTHSSLVMVGGPWVPYYVTAASFAVLGESALAARLPFALAGLATVVLLYLLVHRVTGDRRAATAAALLLALSVQFLLYARECRYYSLNMLLGLALLPAFLRLRTHRFDPWFVVVAVLLYHCHPLPAGAGLAGLGGLTLFHPAFTGLRRAFWVRLPIVLALTLPWMLLSWSAVDENSSVLSDLGELVPRFAQFALEAAVAVPLVGWLILFPLLWRRFTPGDRTWLALTSAVLGAYAVLTPLLMSSQMLLDHALRYASAVLPLAAGITGLLLARASRGRATVLAALLALFGLTHVAEGLVPWMVLPGRAAEGSAPEGSWIGESGAVLHGPRELVDKVLRTEWIGFARELREKDPGSVSEIIAYLDEHAEPDDVLITNYAWEPIYFHTDLPQGMKVMADYPIHPAARSHDLPEYVFNGEGARWVVWRSPWEGYQGFELLSVVETLHDQGRALELVDHFHETCWENRPELRYHRFPGQGYLYPGAMDLVRASTTDHPRIGVLRVTDNAADAGASWSIVAVDPSTREVGVAGVTARGDVETTPGILPGRGAIVATAESSRGSRFQSDSALWRDYGLWKLESGARPREVLAAVGSVGFDHIADDQPLYTSRQYGVAALGFEDEAAAYTGSTTHDWSGDAQGHGVSVQGNRLHGPDVVHAALAAFEAERENRSSSLADRLMAALEAGAAQGGDRRSTERPALSAFLVVAQPGDTEPSLSLVVPAPEPGAADPVAALRRELDRQRGRSRAADGRAVGGN